MADTPEYWPDLAGRIIGDRHVLPIRVYFEDTDFTGLVYHASYLKWCERGRSDFVRLLGIHHKDLISPVDGSESSAFVVRRMEIDFLKPARIDEVLEVVTQCENIGGAVLTLKQKVCRDGTTLMSATVKIVLVGRSGKPKRLGKMIETEFENVMRGKNK